MRTTLSFSLVALFALVALTGSAFAQSGQRIVNLQYQGRDYRVYGDSRDRRLLSSIYGPDWQQSLPYRAAQRLQPGMPAADVLAPYQAAHGNSDIVYNIPYRDSQNLIHPGEQIWANVNGSWQSVTVKPGDSLARIAQRTGTTVDDLVQANGNRFNVWPHAYEDPVAGQVAIPNRMAGEFASDSALDGILAHEGTHTTDRVAGAPMTGNDEGTVPGHSLEEVTSPRGAWVEGLAEYNEALVDPATRQAALEAAGRLSRDPASGNAKDPMEPITNPTHADYIANEATVANTLLGLDGGDPARRAAIRDVVRQQNADLTNVKDLDAATGQGRVSLDSFMTRYLAANPDDAGRALPVYDANTRFTATDDQLRQIAGLAGEPYLNDRERLRGLWNAYVANDPTATPEGFLATLAAPTAASLDGMNLLGQDSSKPAQSTEPDATPTSDEGGIGGPSSPEGSAPSEDGGSITPTSFEDDGTPVVADGPDAPSAPEAPAAPEPVADSAPADEAPAADTETIDC